MPGMHLYKYHTNPETLYGYESMKRFIKPSAEMVKQMFADGESFNRFPYNMITHLPDGLPDELKVRGSFWVNFIPIKIKQLPDGLYVSRDLHLNNTSVTHIGNRTTVGGTITHGNAPHGYTPLAHIGDEVTIGGDLNLSKTHMLDIGDDVTIDGNLNLNESLITHIGDRLKVRGNLSLRSTRITHIGDGLKVFGTLNLMNTPITHLPDDLYVNGNVYLKNTRNLNKDNLPSDMIVKGAIYK